MYSSDFQHHCTGIAVSISCVPKSNKGTLDLAIRNAKLGLSITVNHINWRLDKRNTIIDTGFERCR